LNALTKRAAFGSIETKQPARRERRRTVPAGGDLTQDSEGILQLDGLKLCDGVECGVPLRHAIGDEELRVGDPSGRGALRGFVDGDRGDIGPNDGAEMRRHGNLASSVTATDAQHARRRVARCHLEQVARVAREQTAVQRRREYSLGVALIELVVKFPFAHKRHRERAVPAVEVRRPRCVSDLG
jgi:hypothetical protein